MRKSTLIKARVYEHEKNEAIVFLSMHGITLSDFIRESLRHAVEFKEIPEHMKKLNKKSIKTIENAEKGIDIFTAKDVDDIFKKLGIE